MTSNLGAPHLEKRQGIGFAMHSDSIPAKVEDMVMAEVKRAFNPEFLNRLDEIILFTSLTDEDMLRIIHLLTDQINLNLVDKQIRIRLSDDAARYVLEKNGDRAYGARPLRRALQKYIEDPLSDAIIQGTLPRPAELEVYLGDTGIFCRQINKPAESLEGEEVAVGAGAPDAGAGATSQGIPLYSFT